MKKLLFCGNDLGGLFSFRDPLFRHFSEQGYEVVLVAPTGSVVGSDVSTPSYVRLIQVKLNRTSRNLLEDLAYMARLWRIYRRERPDCIFHYTVKPNVYGTLAARLLGLRSFAMMAGLGYVFEGKSLTNLVAQWLYRFALRFAERVLVLNEPNRDLLVKMGIVPSEKLVLLPGGEGVDMDRWHEGEPLESAETRTTFLMVSRVLYDKGYCEFVAAAKALHEAGCATDADFCLLGPEDESYPGAVPRAVIDADVAAGHIRYLGQTKVPEAVMGRSGVVVVLPSYHEGMNHSLMEAIALGKPVITTDIPGCREMVRQGVNGYTVPMRDAEALAAAMRSYLELPLAQKQAMGRESHRLAQEVFDVRHVLAAYERLLAGQG